MDNPALALYKVWRELLSMRGSLDMQAQTHRMTGSHAWSSGHLTIPAYPSMHYGTKHYHLAVTGFDLQDRPVITLGRAGGYGYDFSLAPDGRFMLSRYWGWKQRVGIAKNTFLGQGYAAGSYRWYVDTHCDGRTDWAWRNDGSPDLLDFKNKIPYINERLISGKQTWLELVPDGGGFRINVASNQAPPGLPASPDPTWGGQWKVPPEASYAELRKAFDKDDRLRELRYLRLENLDRINHGLSPRKMSESSLKVMSGSRPIPTQDAVLQIMALMTVSEPATITPLKREALGGPGGSDNLVASNSA